MLIGVLQVEVLVPDALSLKDKRRVVRSLKDRLHREHQVSVAEVGALDQWRTAILGVCVVSNDAPYVSALFDRVLRKIEATPGARLGEATRDIFSADALPGAGFNDEAGAPLWTPDERRDAEASDPSGARARGRAA